MNMVDQGSEFGLSSPVGTLQRRTWLRESAGVSYVIVAAFKLRHDSGIDISSWKGVELTSTVPGDAWSAAKAELPGRIGRRLL